MTPCSVNNTCTQLGQFTHHPSWAPDFFDRFVLGSVVRRAKLYMHIWARQRPRGSRTAPRGAWLRP